MLIFYCILFQKLDSNTYFLSNSAFALNVLLNENRDTIIVVLLISITVLDILLN